MSKPPYFSDISKTDPQLIFSNISKNLPMMPTLKSSKKNYKMMDINMPPQSQVHEFFDATNVTHSSLQTESMHPESKNTKAVVQHLVLENFKLNECPFQIQHNHKSCPFYHNAKDKKRPGNFFSAELCEYAENDQICPNGELCSKSHNRVEQLYRLDKYKTKFCSFYPNFLDKCEYGIFCSFAHNENDILVELIHNLVFDDDFYMFKYKTIWCPFNLTQHEKNLCVYAHNWQDYRRAPNLYQYEPVQCPNWKSNDYILNYAEGCINKFACGKCHGWKENEFHPLNYKTKICEAGKACNKGRDCPYFHLDQEKRSISNEILFNIFRYYPKNRIISNTFKTIVNEKMNIYQPYSTDIYSTEATLNFANMNLNDNKELNPNNSFTETNLAYLGDNLNKNDSSENQRKSPEDQLNFQSFSMSNLPNDNLRNKIIEEAGQQIKQNELFYPNTTWNKKTPSKGNINYQMSLSQPVGYFNQEITNQEQWSNNQNMSFLPKKNNSNNLGAPNPNSNFEGQQMNNLKKNQMNQKILMNQINSKKNFMNTNRQDLNNLNNQKIQMSILNQMNSSNRTNPNNMISQINQGNPNYNLVQNFNKGISIMSSGKEQNPAHQSLKASNLNINSTPFVVESISMPSFTGNMDDINYIKNLNGNAPSDLVKSKSRINFWTQNNEGIKSDATINLNKLNAQKCNESFEYTDKKNISEKSSPTKEKDEAEEKLNMKLLIERERENEKYTEAEREILKNICEEDNEKI